MIWEPFAMAIVLGLAMSAGLYFAYLWPSVEPDDDADTDLEPAKSVENSEPADKPKDVPAENPEATA